MLFEIREQPDARGCSSSDRRVFRTRTLPRLKEEFGERLVVRWTEPAGYDTRSSPTLLIGGQVVHQGGYLPWEIVRPMVAYAFALEDGVAEFEGEAAEHLRRLGLPAGDWQDGLLAWLTRPGERPDGPPGERPDGPPDGRPDGPPDGRPDGPPDPDQ